MDREFISHQKPIRYETKYGPLYITAVNDYIYVNSNGERNDERNSITMRGVSYSCSAHFFQQPDDSWALTDRDGTRSTVYTSRRDDFKSGSMAAQKAIEELFLEYVVKFAAEHPDMLAKARIIAVNNDIQRVDKEISELQEKLDEALRKKFDLEGKESELKEFMADHGIALPSPGF